MLLILVRLIPDLMFIFFYCKLKNINDVYTIIKVKHISYRCIKLERRKQNHPWIHCPKIVLKFEVFPSCYFSMHILVKLCLYVMYDDFICSFLSHFTAQLYKYYCINIPINGSTIIYLTSRQYCSKSNCVWCFATTKQLWLSLDERIFQCFLVWYFNLSLLFKEI